MHRHHVVKDVLNAHQKMFAIINLDIEFVFNCIVDQHTCPNVKVVVLIAPVSFERDRNSVPTIWIDVAQPLATNLDDALCQNMRLLVEVDVMLLWVVEATDLSRQEECVSHQHGLSLSKL